jgi:hypothetical protein
MAACGVRTRAASRRRWRRDVGVAARPSDDQSPGTPRDLVYVRGICDGRRRALHRGLGRPSACVGNPPGRFRGPRENQRVRIRVSARRLAVGRPNAQALSPGTILGAIAYRSHGSRRLEPHLRRVDQGHDEALRVRGGSAIRRQQNRLRTIPLRCCAVGSLRQAPEGATSPGTRSACLWSRIASAIGWTHFPLAWAMPTGSMVRSALAT